MIDLRYYQPPAVDAIVEFFLSEHKKAKLVVAPTAAGKSIIIAAAAHRLDGNILVFQPTAELLDQNFAKYKLYAKDGAVFSASRGKRHIGRVTFATIGTAKSHPELFRDFKYLIVDEAHLFPPTKDSMFGKFLEQQPQMKMIGLTATPFRLHSQMDGSYLRMLHKNAIYDGFAHIIQIQEIAPTYWSPIKYMGETRDQSILKVKANGSDFTDESLDEYSHVVEKRVMDAIAYFGKKPKLVFLQSVEQCARLSQQVPGAAYVSGLTKRQERDRIIRGLKMGKIHTVFNVNVLGVGFDYPELEVLIDAVPTLSLARYYQKVGRLTRVSPKKEFGTMVDFAGNVDRFGPVESLEIREWRGNWNVYSGPKQLTNVNIGNQFLLKIAPPKEFKDVHMGTGKYKDKKISEVPLDYLRWAAREWSGNHNKLVPYIKMYLSSFSNLQS
jgi:DNA repair protein RadD